MIYRWCCGLLLHSALRPCQDPRSQNSSMSRFFARSARKKTKDTKQNVTRGTKHIISIYSSLEVWLQKICACQHMLIARKTASIAFWFRLGAPQWTHWTPPGHGKLEDQYRILQEKFVLPEFNIWVEAISPTHLVTFNSWHSKLPLRWCRGTTKSAVWHQKESRQLYHWCGSAPSSDLHLSWVPAPIIQCHPDGRSIRWNLDLFTQLGTDFQRPKKLRSLSRYRIVPCSCKLVPLIPTLGHYSIPVSGLTWTWWLIDPLFFLFFEDIW